MLANAIRMHNSKVTWWWHPHKSHPIISSRRPRGAGFKSEWMVFVHKSNVVEIAHKLNSNSCRFLLHSQTRGSTVLKLSEPIPCQAGLNGEQGHFSTSFDSLTYRRQITAGSRSVSEDDNLFLGVRGRFLSLTSIRSPLMRWWDISFQPSSHC